VQLGSLPCKYFGFPMMIGRLKREDEQNLVNRVAGKLPRWKGKMLNRTGRLTLVNSVLSSVVTYHMIVSPLSKWAIRRIDKIRHNFLWHGSKEERKGHCLVNWRWVQLPRKLAGLGILDLAKFNRDLWLRLQWRKWKSMHKPWVHLPVHQSVEKHALLCACTDISLGNGERVQFWHDQWLSGQRSLDLTPALYQLAWRKHNTVAKALSNRNWMKDLKRISTMDEIVQFIGLWC
jgi:hypothetical protein